MSKLRCDSTWAGLTAEQKETMEGWLFDENIGYDETLQRAEKEFNIKGSKMSLVRFYRHLAGERMARDFADLKTAVGSVITAELTWAEVTDAAMALVAKRMVLLALESPEKIKELASLGQVLVDQQAQLIKKAWFEMAREKFEFDTATACLVHKVKMDAITQNESLNDGERIQKFREELFGPNLPE